MTAPVGWQEKNWHQPGPSPHPEGQADTLSTFDSDACQRGAKVATHRPAPQPPPPAKKTNKQKQPWQGNTTGRISQSSTSRPSIGPSVAGLMDRNAANLLFLGPIDQDPGDQSSAPWVRRGGGTLKDGGQAGCVSSRPTNHLGAVNDGGGSNHTGECIISTQLPSVSPTHSHLTENFFFSRHLTDVKYDTLSKAAKIQ